MSSVTVRAWGRGYFAHMRRVLHLVIQRPHVAWWDGQRWHDSATFRQRFSGSASSEQHVVSLEGSPIWCPLKTTLWLDEWILALGVCVRDKSCARGCCWVFVCACVCLFVCVCVLQESWPQMSDFSGVTLWSAGRAGVPVHTRTCTNEYSLLGKSVRPCVCVCVSQWPRPRHYLLHAGNNQPVHHSRRPESGAADLQT